MTRLQGELVVSRATVSSTEAVCARQAEEIARAKADIATNLARIAELEENARNDEDKRRELHNQVQELKGNIRVYCRVRPAIESGGCVACLVHLH